jgi:histidinol-phosphate aminotransferase
VSERTKLVYVTNPNNPTGGMVTRAALERFLDGLPEHVLPVLDEAYFEYVDDPEYPDGASEQLARGRRCVVLRTFSKIYGLAGFRVGYGLCPPDVAAACLKVKNAFDVTQSALDAALASLDAREEVERRRSQTREGRERLAAGLLERGFDPLEGVANFLCVDVGDGAAFAARLERQGVIVRPLGPFGDPASVRISVGSGDELTRLFDAIDAGE